MRIYMQTPVIDDRPPRFYHLFIQEDLLEGWTLVREWGYQGSSGRVVKQHYPTREGAEAALVRFRDAQSRRGYRITFAEGQEKPR